MTHGRTFQIDDAGKLADVYRRLGSRIGSKRVHKQMTSGFASGAALLLAGALLLSLRWAGRLP